MPIELDVSATYKLLFDVADLEKAIAIKCKGCGLTSHNHNDVRERFCGYCHTFHHEIPPGQRHKWVEERQEAVAEEKRSRGFPSS